MANQITLSHPDDLCDLTAEIVTTQAAANARDRRIEKALSAGCDYCSACGREIKNQSNAIKVTFTACSDIAWLGPECAKQMRNHHS